VSTNSLPAPVLRVADTLRRWMWRAVGPRTVGVRGLVLDGDDRVLLVRHTYGAAYWHLPGGGVHRRESIVAALHRELREETGVIVIGPVRLLGTYSSLTEGKSDHISVFVVDTFEREQSESGEIDAARFFPMDELPEDASPATKRRVDDLRRGEVRAFDW
jgi:ADP-ribose pyrophosphatase YjhB (NUDIX family)